MEFPEVLWPSFIHSVRNWILATFIIRPYFDRDFSISEFVKGSKQALVYVSERIAVGDFESLEGRVESEALRQVKKAISTFSVQQRQSLGVQLEDIYFAFPYQIGVMFDERRPQEQQRYVEITMCYHVFNGLGELRRKGEQPSAYLIGDASTAGNDVSDDLEKAKEKIMVCNYRFVREFTKGVEGNWLVNVVSHFKPSEVLE